MLVFKVLNVLFKSVVLYLTIPVIYLMRSRVLNELVYSEDVSFKNSRNFVSKVQDNDSSDELSLYEMRCMVLS